MSAITAGGVKMRRRFLCDLLFVCLLASSSLLAQSNYGVIAGAITDAQHLPIAGATVQLTASCLSPFPSSATLPIPAPYLAKIPFVLTSAARQSSAPALTPLKNGLTPRPSLTPPAYTFGSVGRNSVYGPGLQTMDIALARSLQIKEKTTFQFRFEAFNAL